MKNKNSRPMRKVKFEHISEAYFMYWNMFSKFREYECSQNTISAYFILNNVFSSFLVEIGLKALAINEGKQIKNNHKLDDLFSQLSIEMQILIAKDVGFELVDFKEELRKNAEHFQHWRYFYELETSTFNIKLFDKLLCVMTSLLDVLREKHSKKNQLK